MDTAVTLQRATGRPQLSALSKLTIGALGAAVVALAYPQLAIVRQFQLPNTVFAGFVILAAIAVVVRRRWAPLVGGLLLGLLLVVNISFFQDSFTTPENTHLFVYAVFSALVAVVGLGAGVTATVQAYRTGAKSAPWFTAPGLALALGTALGMLLIGLMAGSIEAGVSPETMAALPAIGTPGKHYSQRELQARAGELVALRLDNSDALPHTFVVDELAVHVEAPAGRQGLVLFTPRQPGTYTFYCDLPGHRDAGMVGTLTVTP
jgi:uncharacterized cupredoxin-like copper-binding protein